MHSTYHKYTMHYKDMFIHILPVFTVFCFKYVVSINQ